MISVSPSASCSDARSEAEELTTRILEAKDAYYGRDTSLVDDATLVNLPVLSDADLEQAYARIADFERELSVVVGRLPSGEARPYPVAWNTHEAGVLVESVVPAPVTPENLPEAVEPAPPQKAGPSASAPHPPSTSARTRSAVGPCWQRPPPMREGHGQIGRASCRERV